MTQANLDPNSSITIVIENLPQDIISCPHRPQATRIPSQSSTLNHRARDETPIPCGNCQSRSVQNSSFPQLTTPGRASPFTPENELHPLCGLCTLDKDRQSATFSSRKMPSSSQLAGLVQTPKKWSFRSGLALALHEDQLKMLEEQVERRLMLVQDPSDPFLAAFGHQQADKRDRS